MMYNMYASSFFSFKHFILIYIFFLWLLLLLQINSSTCHCCYKESASHFLQNKYLFLSENKNFAYAYIKFFKILTKIYY